MLKKLIFNTESSIFFHLIPTACSNLQSKICSIWLSEPKEKQDTDVTNGLNGSMMGQGAFLTSRGCESLSYSQKICPRSSNLSYFIHSQMYTSQICTCTWVHTCTRTNMYNTHTHKKILAALQTCYVLSSIHITKIRDHRILMVVSSNRGGKPNIDAYTGRARSY